MWRAAPGIGQKIRVGAVVPENPLSFLWTEGIKYFQAKTDGAGLLNGLGQAFGGIGVQPAVRPGIDGFAGEVVGGGVGDGNIDVKCRRCNAGQRHDK